MMENPFSYGTYLGVPRPIRSVKSKVFHLRSPGLVDLHFHGAFGIDLMTAETAALTSLARKLGRQGVAGFCPTTLSTTPQALFETVTRLGKWIETGDHRKGALPLGIHLEGPFISPHACGAHPPGVLRPASLTELESLWKASRGQIKILTVAPENLAPAKLKALTQWCRQRSIVLSLGHSRATEAQARAAFRAGFRNVTHAWNAMAFHHRDPGLLAAALGNPEVFVELIIDGVHVHPSVVRWTRAAHPAERLCFVSDCAPAAGTPDGRTTPFGPLEIRVADGASRLLDGRLAGGGFILPVMYRRWLEQEARETGIPIAHLLKSSLPHVTRAPLQSLGIPVGRLGKRQLDWKVTGNRVRAVPTFET